MENVCFDRFLPEELWDRGREVAKAANPANRRSPLEAAAQSFNLWKAGTPVRVHFLDGLSEVQAKVEAIAHQWSQYANLTFEFVGDPDAEIRISFEQNGSWSAVGTDALVEEYFPKDEPTMNFGWLTPQSDDKEYSRVVLHEFGHSLGLIHEHESPAGGIKWNKEAVYRALSGPPNNWDRATIDHNMFEVYDRTVTQFTAFDPLSIMLYSFPKEWTLDGMEFKENTEPSANDKAFVAARYPRS
jgi:serralysin